MFGESKREQLERRLDHKLNATSDGIDMDVPAKVVSSETVYTGRIFHVDDMRIALTDKGGEEHEISRQVLRHAPCVVMLVHDMSNDRYLIEREYRAGSGMFAYGLPAGLWTRARMCLTPHCVNWVRKPEWFLTVMSWASTMSVTSIPLRA